MFYICTQSVCCVSLQEMEDIIVKLEAARRQAQEYQEKYSKEVENTDLK